MFRTKQNTINYDQILKKNSNNESSTDEGSNQKTNIYQLKHKLSPNIVILNNKTLSTHIPTIIPSDKQNYDYKNDIFIKEIIGTDDLLRENNNKFKSLFDLANSKSDIGIKDNIPNRNDSLISKKSMQKKYFNKNDKSLDEYIKCNSVRKNIRKKSINRNKLKIFDYDFNYNKYKHKNYNTPKNDKNRLRIITLNQNDKNSNDSQYKDIIINNIYQNLISTSNKKEVKYNNKFDKNSCISKLIFKNNSNLNKNDLKKIKEKKIQKIIQLMNCNKNPSLNVNLRQEKKDNYISILSNLSNRNNKVFTLQNNLNLNFNDILNSNKSKKKLFVNLNEYKREKTDYYDNIYTDKIYDNISFKNCQINQKIKSRKFRSTTRDNFYRKSQSVFNDLNISTDYTSSEKKNNALSLSKKKSKQLSLDISNKISTSNRENGDINGVNKNIQIKEKTDSKNYKILLNNVQIRMNYLIQNLINYIEFLKKDK